MKTNVALSIVFAFLSILMIILGIALNDSLFLIRAVIFGTAALIMIWKGEKILAIR